MSIFQRSDEDQGKVFLDLIENHWTKSAINDGHGRYCMLGALSKSVRRWYPAVYPNKTVKNSALYEAVVNEIKSSEPFITHEGRDNEINIMMFNDVYASHDDVVALAKRAVAKLN